MAATAFASAGVARQATTRNRSASPMCWLLGAARAALAWACIGINAMLPFSSWPELPTTGRGLLLAAAVLSAGTGFILLLWAADAVSERN